MWKNIEITVSLIIFIAALMFSIYSFYNHAVTMGFGALIVSVVNAYYLVKEVKAKREEDY